MNTTSRWITITAIILAVLALIHWYQVSPKGSPSSTASSTVQTESYSTTTIPGVVPSTPSTNPSTTNPPSSIKNFMHTITIETSKGTIVFQTYDADAPKTSENFVTLANKGFYNGIIFHRVINGFMIQTGDPTGTGSGGPGYKFADEFNTGTASYKAGYVRGTVAMANSGPNTNGSQFFIMHKDYPLPHNYTIFGKVISGMDVVDAIATAERNSSDRPLIDITMKKVTVADAK